MIFLKKFFIVLLVVLISGLFLNSAVAKFMGTSTNYLNQTGIQGTKVENIEGIVGIIISVLTWTYYIFFVIAVLLVIFAAYEYLIGAEDPEKIKSVHKRLIWSAVAVVVALLALSFNLIIQNFIGTRGSTSSSNSTMNSPNQPTVPPTTSPR